MDATYFMFKLNIPQRSADLYDGLFASRFITKPTFLAKRLWIDTHLWSIHPTGRQHTHRSSHTDNRHLYQERICSLAALRSLVSNYIAVKYLSTKRPVQLHQLTLDISQVSKGYAMENWCCLPSLALVLAIKVPALCCLLPSQGWYQQNPTVLGQASCSSVVRSPGLGMKG